MARKPIHQIEKLVGVAVLFSLVVGVIAFLAAILLFFSGEYSAAGICLIAAALTFGLFSVAVLSN